MHLEITVQQADYDLGQEEALLALKAADAGALVAFQGRVRGHDAAVPLTALHLEHYPGVTESEIARIAAIAASRWPLLACRVIHRVGRLLPGEAIVLVLVASSHRHAAFAAAEFLMDYLKTQAPFWKREEFADGRQLWVEARVSDQDACQRWQAES
jgi:molybdopterin synthase catalytic subunit